VHKRLQDSRVAGESFSEVVNRLLDNQSAKTVGEWLNSLVALGGKRLFSRKGRERLEKDQHNPRSSDARRKFGDFESNGGLKRAKTSL
jgi:hypothetical protein